MNKLNVFLIIFILGLIYSCQKTKPKLENNSVVFTDDIATSFYLKYCFQNGDCTDEYFKGTKYPEGFTIGSSCDKMYIPKTKKEVKIIQINKVTSKNNDAEIGEQISKLMEVINKSNTNAKFTQCVPVQMFFEKDLLPLNYDGKFRFKKKTYDANIDFSLKKDDCLFEKILPDYSGLKNSTHQFSFSNSNFDFTIELEDGEFVNDSNDYFADVIKRSTFVKH